MQALSAPGEGECQSRGELWRPAPCEISSGRRPGAAAPVQRCGERLFDGLLQITCSILIYRLNESYRTERAKRKQVSAALSDLFPWRTSDTQDSETRNMIVSSFYK